MLFHRHCCSCYSQSNLLLQHSIKKNQNIENKKEVLWQLLSYQKPDNTAKANEAAPIYMSSKCNLKFYGIMLSVVFLTKDFYKFLAMYMCMQQTILI